MNLRVLAKVCFSILWGLLFLFITFPIFSIIQIFPKSLQGAYNLLKNNHGGEVGRLYAADPVLGFAPIPGARGSELTYCGPDGPLQFDRDGFRASPSGVSTPLSRRPLALVLGCSFSFGTLCPFEHTYSSVVEAGLHGKVLNGGVSSYGLSQMWIRARRFIPNYKPDIVICQYSPWLVERAQTPFAPAYFGLVPVPYLVDSPEPPGLAVHPPLFRTKVFDLDEAQFRFTPPGKKDFLAFLWKVALPLGIHDGWHMDLFLLRKLFGRVASPTADRAKMIQTVYGDIAKLCKAQKATMVIVILGFDTPDSDRQALASLKDVLIVDAQAELVRRAGGPRDFYRYYGHWKGVPPRLLDEHPNERAHHIIAEQILLALRSSHVR